MAREVIERIRDDLDGSENAQTVRIGWQGEWRELDLGERNLAAFAKAFDRYWEVARPSGRGRTDARRGRNGRAKGDRDPKAIRLWAQERGIAIPTRGRIPSSIEEQYRQAGGR